MAKNIFIQSQSTGSYRLTLLTLLLTLIAIAFESIHQINPLFQLNVVEQNLLKAIGLCILVLTYLTWRIQRQVTSRPLFICLGLITLSLLYLTISNYASTHLLRPVVSTLHMLIGLTSASLLWWLHLLIQPQYRAASFTQSKSLRFWAWMGLLMVFVQIYLEGWIDIIYSPWLWQQTLTLYPPATSWLTEHAATIQTLYKPIGLLISSCYIGLLSFFLMKRQDVCIIGVALLSLLLLENICFFIAPSSLWVTIFARVTTLFLLFTAISLLVKLYHRPRENWY